MRTLSLKFIGMTLFTLVFLFGGFFINIINTEAANTVNSFGISYSMSSVFSTTHNDGSVTTRVLIGCAPKSGDLYDINTGKSCTNNIKTTLHGCRVGSGDVYDVNTGIACNNYIKSVLLGCAPKSGDLYDINTGKRCTANTYKIIAKTNTLTDEDLSLLTPINSQGALTGSITGKSDNPEILATTKIDPLKSDLSGREKIAKSLAASVGKAGSIAKGPMSIWIILLILIILLGGGYGVYGLVIKNKSTDKKEVKSESIKSTAPSTSTTPAQPHLYTTVKVAPSVTEPIFQQTQINPIPNNTQSGTNTTPNNQHQGQQNQK